MRTARQVLIALYVQHNGNWDKMYNDIWNKVLIPSKYFKKTRRIEKHFITILDKDYPEYLKSIYKPPFVIKKGEIK